MSVDKDDRILESCLEEVLGGQAPPDLSSRILQALNCRESASSGNGVFHAAAVQRPARHDQTTVEAIRSRSDIARQKRNRWLNVALLASFLTAIVSVGALISQLVEREQDSSDSVVTPGDRSGRELEKIVQNDNKRPEEVVPRIKQGTLAKRDRNENDRVTPNVIGPDRDNGSDRDMRQQFADTDRPVDTEVVALIDGKLSKLWAKYQVVPGSRVDDETWCRRLYDAVIGRSPSSEELDAFLADSSADKRRTLVDRLLADVAYSDEFATHFAAAWSDMLIGPAGGRRKGDLASREGLRRYLRDSFAVNKPVDAIARELIAANGSGKPGSSNFNGAANFLLAHLGRRGETATAHVSRVFLGQSAKCAQCHDHSAGDEALAQRDFWQLNSFFRQVDFERGSEPGEFALVDRDFDGEGDDPNDAEVYFETPDGRLQVAYPILFGKSIPTSGYVDDVNRRQELAKLITESDQFDQTFVNHFWKTFFLYELPTSQKDGGELIDELAVQFRASGYDVKSLVRWIALSDAFALPSEVPSYEQVDSPELGGMALFSRFYQRTAKREKIATGLVAATKAFKDGSANAMKAWYGSVAPQASPSNAIIAPELVAPVPELSIIRLDDREMVRRISAAKGLEFNDKVKHLFWAAVTRNPTDRELNHVNQLWMANKGDSFEALEAVWLVLTNSDEFISE